MASADTPPLSRCSGTSYRFQFVNMTPYPVKAQYLRQYVAGRTLADGTRVYRDPMPYATTSVAGDTIHNSITVHPFERGTAAFVPSPNTPPELNKVVLAFFQLREHVMQNGDTPHSLAWEAAQSMEATPSGTPAMPDTPENGRLALQYLQFDTDACEFKVLPTASTAQGFGVRHVPDAVPDTPMTFVLYDGPVSQGARATTPWLRALALVAAAAACFAALLAAYWVRTWYKAAFRSRDRAGLVRAVEHTNRVAATLARTAQATG